MQQVVILASSLWKIPSKQEQEYFEKNYLKLANYVLSEKIAGKEVKVVWFCSSPVVSETISNFSIDYNISLEFIVLEPSTLMIDSSQKQTELDKFTEHEIAERELIRLENDFWEDSFPTEIDLYISERYSSELEIMPPSALGGLPVWFVANIANEGPSYLEENSLLESYIELFPPVFQPNALSLLATCFDNIGTNEPWGIINKYKVQLLCLTKLLHGFVSASDYDFNHFSVTETADSLDINDLYLGGLLSKDMFEELSNLDYETEDDYQLRTDFLESIAREQVCALVTTLTKRFGVTELCAMLWWCLYPHYTQSVYDKFDALFNRMDFDFSPELMQVYNLLEDGWSDYADNN